MNILFICFVARFVSATNYTDNFCYTKKYFELCSKEDYLLFSPDKPTNFLSTKQSCNWKLYSDLIYYKDINYNAIKNFLHCTQTIKDKCRLATNDIVSWVNKQEENTKKCIKIYFKKYNEHCYEGTCSYAIYSPKAAVYDLPFCSADYAYFV